jgi:hypothetical protein
MATQWQVTGEYFENCNCKLVCPCLVSAQAPLTSTPTEGDCHVVMVFRIDQGRFGDVKLDGLKVALIAESHGAMGSGNMTGAAYIDERANDRQMEALGAIFGGSAGGPMAMLAPLFGKNLGAKKARITFGKDGKTRSAEIPDVLHMSVHALPSLAEGEIWAATGHPCNPTHLAFAVGDAKSTFADYGLRWDNSGRNAHYAPISWSG